jgi:two-component system sensor histidine kinase ComP
MIYLKYIRFILIIFAIFQIWFVHITWSYSYTGILVDLNEKSEWVISDFADSGKEIKTKLRVGDRIESIDGKSPDDVSSVRRWRSIDQATSIVIIRDGERFELPIQHLQSDLKINLLPFIGGIISLFFMLLIPFKVRNSTSSILLSYLFFTFALVYMSINASIRGDVLGKMFISNGLVLIPIVFLHFLIAFFKEKGNIQIKRGALKYLYGAAGLLFLVKALYFIPSIAYEAYKMIGYVTLLFFLLGLVLNFIQLTNIYIKYRRQSPYLSMVIKTIWAGLFVSIVPVAFFSFLPMLVFHKAWLDPYYTNYSILFFPITFAYLIISKQLYDIESLLRRFLFTTIISVLPSLIILIAYDISLNWTASAPQLFVGYIIVLTTISLVLYSLEYLASKFEPVVFPRKHKLQTALRKISKDLGSITSFREMKEIILVDIVKTLQVYGGAVVFKYAHHIEIISEGDINPDEVERLVQTGWFEDHPSFTCFEINRHEEYTSYLVMTKKRTNTVLGLEDRQWLSLIISYLAVSLENVYLIRKLTMRMQELAAQLPNEEAGQDFIWFRKLMFELQEKERIRIATDLHDTTLQDLFFLKKKFASLMDNLHLTQQESEKAYSIVEFIEIINTNLRQNCFDLHPHLLQEIGLVQTIEKLVERESYESSFEIKFNGERAYSIEYLSMDTKRHLFRIVQELITNAKKHSEATEVHIEMIADKTGFSLTYSDNGIGFDEGRSISKEIGGTGIGMEQLRSRTLYLNGNFHLDTSKGHGVKIQITIPIKGGLTA